MNSLKKEDYSQNERNKINRSYLVGNTIEFNPQIFTPIHDVNLEFAITKHSKDTFEDAHYNDWNDEFNYIVSGKNIIYFIDSEELVILNSGDFIKIPSKTKYISKSKEGTEIVTVKIPGGNDKISLKLTDKDFPNNWFEKI